MTPATPGCEGWRGGDDRQPVNATTRFSPEVAHQKWARGAQAFPSDPLGNAMREDIDARFAFARRGHVRNDRCGWQRDHVRPRAWVRRSAVHRPGSGDRRTDGNFPIRMWAATGPSRVQIALNNISTPRNQQYERAKEHKCNDRVKTSKPGDAMTKRKMDG